MATLYACAPIVTVEQVHDYGCECIVDPDDAETEAIVEGAIDAASDILAILSGFRVIGVCERTVRPVGSGACWPVSDYSWSGADRFGGLATIDLGGPSAEVSKITIDGVDLDPSEYTLLDGQYLLRREGAWPSSNDLRLASGEGTWSITFTIGDPFDFLAVSAALELACELAALRLGKKSQLPAGVSAANIQGAAVIVDSTAQGEQLQNTKRFLSVYAPNGPAISGVWAPELELGWNLVTVS